jgi:hypothetical protein
VHAALSHDHWGLILHSTPTVLIARQPWNQCHLNSCITSFGGDHVYRPAANHIEGPVWLLIPPDKDSSVQSVRVTTVFHTGLVKFGNDNCQAALCNYTAYPNGPASALAVDPSEKLDPDGLLRFRLLYEGCGYQARPVSCEEANTYYVVYWKRDGSQPPTIFLHVLCIIDRMAEITRPALLMSRTTVHHVLD